MLPVTPQDQQSTQMGKLNPSYSGFPFQYMTRTPSVDMIHDSQYTTLPPRLGVHGAALSQSLQAATSRLDSGTEDSLGSDSLYQLTQDQIDEIREMFSAFDRDGDQAVSPTEIRWLLRFLGQNPSLAEINKLIATVDADGNGQLDHSEFLQFMSERYRQPLSSSSLEHELKEVFRVFARIDDNTSSMDVNGYLGVEEMKRVLQVGLEIADATDEDAKRMIEIADLDGTGKLTWEQFYAAMTCPGSSIITTSSNNNNSNNSNNNSNSDGSSISGNSRNSSSKIGSGLRVEPNLPSINETVPRTPVAVIDFDTPPS